MVAATALYPLNLLSEVVGLGGTLLLWFKQALAFNKGTLGKLRMMTRINNINLAWIMSISCNIRMDRWLARSISSVNYPRELLVVC